MERTNADLLTRAYRLRDPIGQTLAQAGDDEDVRVSELSMERLEEARRTWPFLRDRRPDSHGRLVPP